MSNVPVAWRAWLPESALAGAGIDQALADITRQWSAKWLARKSLRPLGALAETRTLPADGSLRWMVLDNDVAIALSGAAIDRLAMLMLGENAPQSVIEEADRPILKKLGEDALQDLCRRIAETLGLAPDARWQELGEGDVLAIGQPRTCQLGVDAASPLLHVALATEVLVARAKVRAGRSPVRARVKSIAAGLAAEQVYVSAALGTCSLTLSDLAGLGVGDVLVLDHMTDAPLALALNAKAARRGKFAVQRDGDRLELKLLEPLLS